MYTSTRNGRHEETNKNKEVKETKEESKRAVAVAKDKAYEEIYIYMAYTRKKSSEEIGRVTFGKNRDWDITHPATCEVNEFENES